MVIKSVMDEFCKLSGLKVSLAKSKVFYSPNTNLDLVQSISDGIGIPSTYNLGKHLGFSILHG